MNMLVIGSCRVASPLATVEGMNIYPGNSVYTVREIIQAIDYIKGTFVVPKHLKKSVFHHEVKEQLKPFSFYDGAIIEIGSTRDYVYKEDEKEYVFCYDKAKHDFPTTIKYTSPENLIALIARIKKIFRGKPIVFVSRPLIRLNCNYYVINYAIIKNLCPKCVFFDPTLLVTQFGSSFMMKDPNHYNLEALDVVKEALVLKTKKVFGEING